MWCRKPAKYGVLYLYVTLALVVVFLTFPVEHSILRRFRLTQLARQQETPDTFTTSLVSCRRDALDDDGYVCEPLAQTISRPTLRADGRATLETTGPTGAAMSSNPQRPSVLASSDLSKTLLLQALRSNSTRTSPIKLITLFTTMKDIVIRDRIHMNTLLNWSTLSPWLCPVLFVPGSAKSERWMRLASQLGWKLIRTDYLSDNVPILKWMFKIVEQSGYDTPFIGYANADILFDGELLKTLLAIQQSYGDLDTSRILITGRRRNVHVSVLRNVTCLSCLRKIGIRAPLYQVDAEDYFIFSRAGFPWDMVPEFIVGSPGYDNWLVAKALSWGVDVIDGSTTINAVHQVGAEGVKAGWNFNRNKHYNLRLVSPSFRYEVGNTYCATLRTVYSSAECLASLKHCIKLVRREPNEMPHSCQPTSVVSTTSMFDYISYDD